MTTKDGDRTRDRLGVVESANRNPSRLRPSIFVVAGATGSGKAGKGRLLVAPGGAVDGAARRAIVGASCGRYLRRLGVAVAGLVGHWCLG